MGLDPLLAGFFGAILTTWVTFVPCFLWIFLGAPYVERLRSNRALSGALAAITAAVVGVILNLAVWFGLHVIFATVDTLRLGTITIASPLSDDSDARTRRESAVPIPSEHKALEHPTLWDSSGWDSSGWASEI